MLNYLSAKAVTYVAACDWFSGFSFDATTDPFWSQSWVKGSIRLAAIVAVGYLGAKAVKALMSSRVGNLVGTVVMLVIALAFMFNPALLPSVVGAATSAIDVVLGWIDGILGNAIC